MLKRTTALAAVLAASVAGSAFAQSDNASTTGADNAAPEASQAGEMGTYGDLISNLQSNSGGTMDPATMFQDVGDSSSIETVLLSELQGEASGNAEALDQALTAQDAQIADVRSAIDGNPALTGALDAEGYTSSDVVAVDQGAEGNVTLVIDDQS